MIKPYPDVLVLNAAWMAQNKARIAAGDPALHPAFSNLLAQADAALREGPFSVMDKTLTPPSGDKHDYLSFGPYWWPDPTKPDGLPYIRKDGEVNPESTMTGSDSPSMKKMVGAVETLALAFYFSDHPAYAAHAARLLQAWFLDPATRMNPHVNYGQGIPGRVDGRCIGIIDTHALVRVVDAAALIAGTSTWTPAEHQALKQWFADYLQWLLTSPYGLEEARQPNNHGTWYDAQVAAYAWFAGKADVATHLLATVGTNRIARQIEPDGRQPHELGRTKSFDYSTMNLNGFFILAQVAGRTGMDLWQFETHDKRSLRAALDFLAPYADPAKPWPHPQIGESQRHRLLPLLWQGAMMHGSPEYRNGIHTILKTDGATRRECLLYPPL